MATQQQPAVIVTHGGVIRSILSFITNTQLADSFKVFKLHYGSYNALYAPYYCQYCQRHRNT
ncbi:MAG: hypothetical protein EAZ16_08610 [Sphingobacteriales bacterium]|nr:MAG: hypothetical protein EAZ16_08610 [Sphingobacteriales bacterium]